MNKRSEFYGFNKEKVRQGVKLILEGIGEDLEREGLRETPDRVAKLYEEIFSALGQTDSAVVKAKVFAAEYHGLVVENDITFYSMCEHHLLPFFGQAHIAYLADGEVLGLSKLARTVEFHASQPQLQERLTQEIAASIDSAVKNEGVLVMVAAEHLCVSMRGIRKPGVKTLTLVKLGKFTTDQVLCDQALALFGSGGAS